MSSYIITEQDKEEFINEFYLCTVNDDQGLFRQLQIIMKKSKWGVKELQFLNEYREKGARHCLYRLFHIKGRHPLYLRYYPAGPEDLSSEAMKSLAEYLDDETIPIIERTKKIKELGIHNNFSTDDIKSKIACERLYKRWFTHNYEQKSIWPLQGDNQSRHLVVAEVSYDFIPWLKTKAQAESYSSAVGLQTVF